MDRIFIIFGYDTMSNLTSQTDALGNTTNYEYDDFNRIKKIKYPLPTAGATPRLEENFTYNKLGEVASHTDTAGRTTSYVYFYWNNRRYVMMTDALSNVTYLAYNRRMQLIEVTDALSQEYVFTYDPLGRVLSQTRNGQTMSFGYDAAGNRTSRTDYNGNATGYAYDDVNRLTAITYAGTSSEYI